MRTTPRTDLIAMIEELSEAQHGYFTRAQAHDVGVRDVQLSRATDYGQIRRLDHGIYRVAGAGHDEHADLRIAWLRLDPKRRARERTKNPTIWVSHQSAAVTPRSRHVHPADPSVHLHRPQTTPLRRLHVQVRPDGLTPDQWVIRDGMAVTSPLQTLIDLDAANTDGGHLGAFLRDAIDTGAIRTQDLNRALLRTPVDALLDMAGNGTGR